MQEVHSIVGGDKMMSSHHNLQHHHLALKCPRCDSFNTKFCYYNNYNLSQPRHFCKNCRRYWTKGGVLRNVPVGGSSRKSKKSNKSKTASSSSTTSTPPPPEAEQKTESHSNSESSTFTSTAAMEEMSKTPISNVKVNSFRNLVTSSSTNNSFSFGKNGSDQVQVVQRGDSLGQWQQHISNGFGSLDWHGGAVNGLFDVPNTVDRSSYWTHSHWSDHINHPSSLFHLH